MEIWSSSFGTRCFPRLLQQESFRPFRSFHSPCGPSLLWQVGLCAQLSNPIVGDGWDPKQMNVQQSKRAWCLTCPEERLLGQHCGRAPRCVTVLPMTCWLASWCQTWVYVWSCLLQAFFTCPQLVNGLNVRRVAKPCKSAKASPIL